MKILHVINSLDGIGGAEKSLSNIVNQSDCKTVIVSLLKVNNEVINKLFSSEQTVYCLSLQFGNILRSLLTFKRILRKEQPDCIQSWMYAANVYCSFVCLLLFTKLNVVWGVHHSLDDIKKESNSTKVAIYLSKILSCHPSSIIFCAQRSMQQHIKFGFNRKTAIFIPNGHNIPATARAPLTSELLVIGMAGRFHFAKDWKNGIDAVKILSENTTKKIVLRIAGENMQKNNHHIVNWLQVLDPKKVDVQLLGLVNNMPTFYQQLDVFLLSSRTEGFPNVVCEAMSYGVPCVGTDVGDVAYIISDYFAVAPAEDSLLLAEKLCQFFNLSRDEYLVIRDGARHRIRDLFDVKEISLRYEKVWACNQ